MLHDDDETGPRDAGLHWIVGRWAFLVFNVAVAMGWIFWLSWPRGGSAWVTWTTRALITVQLLVAVLGLLGAYRRHSPGEALLGNVVIGEAWVYLFMAVLCSFAMGLSMV